jgi:hypothetical protein
VFVTAPPGTVTGENVAAVSNTPDPNLKSKMATMSLNVL